MFVGLKNYRHISKDPLFILCLKNTAIFSVGSVIGMTVIGLFSALLLNRVKLFMSFARTIFFLPVITSMVAVGILFQYLYQPGFGLINSILGLFHIPPQQWILSTKQSLLSVILMNIWKWTGFYTVIFLAGLQGIPEQLYEAARLDGAKLFSQFKWITLPLLKPTMLFALVINVIGSFQVFTQVFMLTRGGPVNSSNVVVLYLYDTAFSFLRMGRATAMAFFLFVILIGLTVIQMMIFKKGAVVPY